MELMSIDELKDSINNFDVREFFKDSESNISKGGTGVITSRQIILLENGNDGISLHIDMLKNIYYNIFPKIKELVDKDNTSLEKWVHILSRENIIIKLGNERNKIVIIEFPLLDGITYEQYELFELFMDKYYRLFMECSDNIYVKVGMDFYALKEDGNIDTTLDEILDIACEYINEFKSKMNDEVIVGITKERIK